MWLEGSLGVACGSHEGAPLVPRWCFDGGLCEFRRPDEECSILASCAPVGAVFGYSAFCILPSAFPGRSGGSLELVWGRSHEVRLSFCGSATCGARNLALGAPVCPGRGRRGDGEGPAKP